MSRIDVGARDLAAAVQAGLPPQDVATAALARVADRNPGLNALCHVADDLDRQAQRVADRLAVGETLPLAGVPVVIKDNIWVRGMPATQGSRLFAGYLPPDQAHAVTALQQAGAMILGMGSCSEFAAKGVTATPLHGVTHHPMNPDLTPGGSSGGPAVAVAAGLAPLALGTDAGGSSRRPPAHVGVVGFKPTQDAVPYGPGFPEPFWNISCLAPIARDVGDAALMFRVLSKGGVRLAPARPVKALRIGYVPTLGLDLPLDAGVRDAMAAAIAALRGQGITIMDDGPVWPDGAAPADVMALQTAGLAMFHGTCWQAEPDLFDPDLGRQIEAGLTQTGTDVARAMQASHLMRTTLRAYFQQCDLLISATSSALAWPWSQLGPQMIGGRPAAPRDHAAFTSQYNHAGLPALSLPCGAASGLPVGMQIGAGHAQDATLLAAAAAFETIFYDQGLWPANPKG